MQLEHLPRAERLLKRYLDTQVSELMSQSDAVARKYLASREQFIAKSRDIAPARIELARMLAVMENALPLQPAARDLIPEARGMSLQEISRTIEELSELIKLFPEGDNREDSEVAQESPQEMEKASVADLNELSSGQYAAKQPPSALGSRKYMGVLIQTLEGGSCLAGVLAIAYFLLA